MNLNLRKEIIIFALIFLASSVFIYLFFNAGAYFQILRYGLFRPILGLESSTVLKVNQNTEGLFLYIPKIGVSAPIVFPKSDSNESILTALEQGVVIYPGSQLPGEIGRSIILGHSSKIDWYRGDFAYVFALLSKLQSGDEFYIMAGNKKLTYKVFSSDILTPEKTDEILSRAPRNESDIALITCWPIGFSSQRTLVQAKLEN